MSDQVQIQLQPLGQVVQVARGTALQEVLFAHGVEFPCGGRGRCRGCKVKVLAGDFPLNPAQLERLTTRELEAGWRLACQGRANGDLSLELAQWEAAILADNTAFEFTPRAGLGVAVDLGTTTLVSQLLDLRTGQVLAVKAALNSQAQYGADIMSRVQFALAKQGLDQLKIMIRRQIGGLIQELFQAAKKPSDALTDVVLVGNTVMHHLFCGLDLTPLAHYPFASETMGLQVFRLAELGWSFGARSQARFLPCLGGFVGSDLLAGIRATRLMESNNLEVLIDLGTNGEIVVGNHQRLLCASTAAGPAFEGARIAMGMRAATGAISEVALEQGKIVCRVLGNVAPRGICGSGLVDAVAAGLALGNIQPSGRLLPKNEVWSLCPPVHLTQADVREVQLAKGAIAAGIRILLEEWGAAPGAVSRVYLAGAFGNYINRQSARRIGLFDFALDQVAPAGNTALLGAKLALFCLDVEPGDYLEIRRRVRHLSLSDNAHFQDVFLQEMTFNSNPINPDASTFPMAVGK